MSEHRPRLLALAVLAGAALASACGKRPAAPVAIVDAGVTAVTEPELEKTPVGPWADLVRRGRYAEARPAIEALPESDKSRPEMRYLRARVALALGDGGAALRMLDGLEGALPLLADDVRARRADAAFAAGRFKEAGDAYVARPGASFQLKASRAYERALDAVRARAAADHVANDPKAARVDEAEARARRLRLGGRTPREDADDARWLAVEAPDLPDGEGAEARLRALDPEHPLTTAERSKRARALADVGRVDEAIKALEDGGAAGGASQRLERLRSKAEVYYRSRNHPLLAARTFDEVVAIAGPSAIDDAFKAARALSRADHDDEAIERYLALARRAPKSKEAEEATFLAARLHLIHARPAQAASVLDEHQKRWANARKEATRMRALAHLMAGHHAQAIRLFEELSDDEREPLGAARARSLAAYAALKNGDRTLAVARYGEVARARPFSWPALVARTHLQELKAPVPPSFEAPPDPADVVPLAVNLPPPVDLLHRIGLDDDAEDALRDREAAVTAVAPGRATEALCAAYAKLGRARRLYQVAQQIPQAALFAPPIGRGRWAWDCAYPSPFAPDVTEVEAKEALPPGLLHAVMRQESGFDTDVVSPARAVGLLQLLPETGRTVAGELALPWDDDKLTDPSFNVKLGGHYLHGLVARFHGSVPLALAGYNGGPDNVAKWLGRLRGVPLDLFVEHIPFAETRGYVVRVMGNLARYAYLRGGEDALPALSLAPVDPSPPP